MAQRSRLTNNSDETDVAALISGDSIFSIPYFQRPYKWKSDKLKQLNQDLLDLVDESSDIHFLGAVILHGRRSNPSDPDVFDVIDGQQRITTIFLYLCAAIRVLTLADLRQEAAGLFLKYLVINRDTGATSNYKLHSCKDDRNQLNAVFSDLLSDKQFREQLGAFALKRLPASGSDRGGLLNNYRYAVRFFKDELEQGKVERVRAIYGALLNRVSIVQIDVWDPTNGPKIFDSLNSKQQPITVGDLIRNEVFSRVANQHVATIERIDAEQWQPFYKAFERDGKNLFDGYFFPFGLIKYPNLKKSEAYSVLRKEWDGIESPEEIIEQLKKYQQPYVDLRTGSNLSGLSRFAHAASQRFPLLGAPSSILPFMMQLLEGVAKESVSESTFGEVCGVVESFLVRRAVCGIEPTGLHAVFKRLWKDCAEDLNASRVRAEISKHKTVPWPDDPEFFRNLVSRELADAAITPFFLKQYDVGLGGDQPSMVTWIEHVLPQNPEDSWFEVFSREQHASLKNTLANLIPLSSEMNRSLGNRSYAAKRKKYSEDSAFKSARQFAQTIEDWTPQALNDRANAIANWALLRWPVTRDASASR